MEKKYFLCYAFITILTSCTFQDAENKKQTKSKAVVTAAQGNISDSIIAPVVIVTPESKLKIVQAGKPIITPTNTNIFKAIQPAIIEAGQPVICTPGQDTFPLPITTLVIDSPFIAMQAEVVTAKDPHIRDKNSHSFGSFGKLQGLKHETVRAIIEDSKGNLWFGTKGGGASKYDGKNFTNYVEKSGLSSNVVTCMLEDKNGNIWFGTYNGVTKYDGQKFSWFTTEQGLVDNFLLSIIEDSKGNIWMGTFEGVSKLAIIKNADSIKYAITNYTVKEGLASNVVYNMEVDKNGNIWFAGNGGSAGVSKFDGISFNNYSVKHGLADNLVLSLFADKDGNIWMGTGAGGVSKFDGNYFQNYSIKEGLADIDVLSILQDKNGNMWFGHYGDGISKYDGKNFTHYNLNEGLNNGDVWAIAQDKTGNLWFGTDGGGVSKYEGEKFIHFAGSEVFKNFGVSGIQQDKEGNLWFGAFAGGIAKYDGKSFAQFVEKSGLNNEDVEAILIDSHQNLWIATHGLGIAKYDGKNFTQFSVKDGLIGNENVLTIIEDLDGNIWVGTFFGISKITVKKIAGKDEYIFTNYTTAQGLGSNTIKKIIADRQGNIWIGTTAGLTKYNGKNFINYTQADGVSPSVNTLLQDSKGNIWSAGEFGATKYDGKSFVTLTVNQGLTNNNVTSILEDKHGNLWFGTSFGLNMLSKKNLELFAQKTADGTLKDGDVFFKNYNYDDGFLGIGCNSNSLFEDKDKTLWIGANDRLTAFFPTDENIAADTIAPVIEITGIEIFNEQIDWMKLMQKKDTSITLSNGVTFSNFLFDGVTKWNHLPRQLSLAYNNNFVSFNFIGITHSQSKLVKYQYKLSGLAENWSGITANTKATFGSLQPGEYTYIVKAMNSEGYWSKEAIYRFGIRSPWWATWWFRLIVALAFSAAGYAFYSYRLQQALKLQSLRNRIASDLHDEIGSTISSISLSSNIVEKKLNGNQPEVAKLVHQISENTNNIMEVISDIVWTINTKNDSLANVVDRMRAFAVEILESKNIKIHFDIDDAANNVSLGMDKRKNLYLVFKECINNTAKYSQCNNVWIEIKLHHKKVFLKIKDDGVGFNVNEKRQNKLSGNGLYNMQKRANDLNAKFEIASQPEQGTAMLLEFGV